MKKLFLSVAALFAVCIVSAQEGVVASYNKGAEMLQSKNYPEAAKLFQKVIDEGMASEDATELNCVETAKKYLPTCYPGMGTRAAAQGNHDAAIANLSKAAEVAELYGNVAALKKANTILAKVYQAQGGTAFNNKDYAAAAEIFAKGYAADPKNTQMALWLGTCYCELKDYDKGMEILEKVAGMQGPKFEADAAEANRLLTLYTNNRVAELQTANDQDGIIAMADKMLEQNPANALAQKIRLQAYLTKKDYAKVIELGEAAAAAAQPDETEKSDVYFILGAAYNAKEMKPQAIEALKKVTAGDNVAAAQKSVAELSKESPNTIREAGNLRGFPAFFLSCSVRRGGGSDFPAKHCLSYFFGKSRAESVRRTPPIRFRIRCDNGKPPSAACNDGFRRQSARQLRCSPSAGDKKAGGDIADKQVPENKRMKEKYRLSLAC